jgi:hypothetical protein
MGNGFRTRGKRVAVLSLLAAGVVGAALAARASAVIIGDGQSCYRNGTTPAFVNSNIVYSNVCWANKTGFKAYYPGASSDCLLAGYVARVANTNYDDRFRGYFCYDNLWHYTNPWPSNEWRFGAMYIMQGGVDWAMQQFPKP